MSQLIREKNWTDISIGSPDSWPQSLKTAIGIILNSSSPMLLIWETEYVIFFNDAYQQYFGQSIRKLLGAEFTEATARISGIAWNDVEEAFSGNAIHHKNHTLVPLFEKNPQQVRADIGFQPIFGEEDRITGVTVAIHPSSSAQNGDRSAYVVENSLYDSFMQVPTFIAILKGPDHTFELANPMYMKLVGKDRDVIGKPMQDALPEAKAQGFLDILNEVYSTGKPFKATEYFTRIDRSGDGNLEDAYLNFVYHPYRDHNGRIQGIFVHGVDATEQVLIRRRVTESEQKYRTLFESMDQGFCLLEMIYDETEKPVDYRFLEVNPVFKKQTGLRDPVGKTAKELVPDLEEQWVEIYGKVALTGQDMHFNQGSEAMGRWFEVYAFRPRSSHVALLYTEISGKKKVEMALRENENLMKLITNSLPAFISYVNTDERYVFANQAYEGWFGLSKEEIVGKTVREVLGEDSYHRTKPLLQRGLAGEKMTFENMHRNHGETKYLKTSYIPDVSADGVVKGMVAVGHDITDYKKSQDALKKSEEYYKTMTDNTPVMTWITGPDGECSFLNKQWYEYTGQSPDSASGFGWLEAVHPEDVEKSRKVLLGAHMKQTSFSHEYRLRDKAGHYRWHLETGLPKFDEQGNYEGFIGSVIDVHERMLVEAALKMYGERFKLVVESSPYALIMINDRGRITMINSQTEKLFGYTKSELINEPVEGLLPDRYHAKSLSYQNHFRQFRNTEFMASGNELFGLRKDGTEVPVEIALNPIEMEEGLFMLSSIVDITERKRADRALRESEEFNRTLLESTPDCVKALDTDGKLISINSRGMIMLEIDDFSEYKGRVWTDLWEGKYYNEAVMAVEKAQNGHLGHFQGFSSTTKGTSRWWDVLVAPVYGVSGAVERLVAVSRDITKLKELEHQKDDFIGIASHELKTPVTSIKAYAQVLQNRIHKLNDMMSAEMLTKMDRQLSRLTNLIADLLDVTKIEQGRLKFKQEHFAFNALVEEVVQDIQSTTHRHRIVRKIDRDVLIRGDRDRIGQVLTNFLTNAIKYSPKADKIIVRTSISENKLVVLSVEDFGLGLSQENQIKVFERFYRVEGSGYETYPGLGLGLFIAAGIIQRHQGKIWVESKRGEGSTFYFSLPYENYELN